MNKLTPRIKNNYFELKKFTITLFVALGLSIKKTVLELNKQSGELKFNKNKVIALVIDYCKENTLVPKDYKLDSWQKVLDNYQPDLFQDFHNSDPFQSSVDYLKNIINTHVEIDETELPVLCSAVFKRSMGSQMVTMQILENALIEDEQYYQNKLRLITELDGEDIDTIENMNKKAGAFIVHTRNKVNIIQTMNKLNALSFKTLTDLGFNKALASGIDDNVIDGDFDIEITEYKGKNAKD